MNIDSSSNDGMMNFIPQQQQQDSSTMLNSAPALIQQQQQPPPPPPSSSQYSGQFPQHQIVGSSPANFNGPSPPTQQQQQQQQSTPPPPQPQMYSYGMNAAPMPADMRRFDPAYIAQQQQQHHQQQYMSNGKINHTANINFELGPKPSVDEKLAKDITTFTAANLLDDESILDDLYRLRRVFSEPYLCTSYLISLYLSKYDSLIKLYPTLPGWLIFTITYLRHNSEENYRLLNQNRAARLTASANPKFALLPRARNVKRGASMAQIKSNNPETTDFEAKKRKLQLERMMEERKQNLAKASSESDRRKLARQERLENHPFLKCQEYKTWGSLCRIGQYIRYLAPGDFAVAYMRASIGDAKRIISEGLVKTFKAINVTFDIPVLSKISVVQKKHLMAKCADFDSIDQAIVQMCNGKVDGSFEFDYGILKKQVVNYVENDTKDELNGLKRVFESSDAFFYICSSFSSFLYGTSTLQHKGYSSELYQVSQKSYTSETDAVGTPLQNYIDNNCQAVFDEYDEQYPCEDDDCDYEAETEKEEEEEEAKEEEKDTTHVTENEEKVESV